MLTDANDIRSGTQLLIRTNTSDEFPLPAQGPVGDPETCRLEIRANCRGQCNGSLRVFLVPLTNHTLPILLGEHSNWSSAHQRTVSLMLPITASYAFHIVVHWEATSNVTGTLEVELIRSSIGCCPGWLLCNDYQWLMLRHTSGITWQHAEETCRSYGGHLATYGRNPNDRECLDRVALTTVEKFYIGAQARFEGRSFKWVGDNNAVADSLVHLSPTGPHCTAWTISNSSAVVTPCQSPASQHYLCRRHRSRTVYTLSTHCAERRFLYIPIAFGWTDAVSQCTALNMSLLDISHDESVQCTTSMLTIRPALLQIGFFVRRSPPGSSKDYSGDVECRAVNFTTNGNVFSAIQDAELCNRWLPAVCETRLERITDSSSATRVASASISSTSSHPPTMPGSQPSAYSTPPVTSRAQINTVLPTISSANQESSGPAQISTGITSRPATTSIQSPTTNLVSRETRQGSTTALALVIASVLVFMVVFAWVVATILRAHMPVKDKKRSGEVPVRSKRIICGAAMLSETSEDSMHYHSVSVVTQSTKSSKSITPCIVPSDYLVPDDTVSPASSTRSVNATRSGTCSSPVFTQSMMTQTTEANAGPIVPQPDEINVYAALQTSAGTAPSCVATTDYSGHGD
ncbi:uncharacterized protein LOC135826360 [Sycon ciliatum]|uniref:uncharacterized protein LOC135826360 n=1 Tax=Sycon ciliatum TaxID=27933 RepID=UPI0031F70999